MMLAEDQKVYISSRGSRCDECREDLGRGAWITLAGEGWALCLSCADLDHLVFLAAGDAALTRRAHKHSRLTAVVLKWSRARKRYERQGLLVENEALDRAGQECKADAKQREVRRVGAAERRAELDDQYVSRFGAWVRELYPQRNPMLGFVPQPSLRLRQMQRGSDGLNRCARQCGGHQIDFKLRGVDQPH